jgi:hypothetical protein
LSDAAVEKMRLYLDAEKDYRGNKHAGWTDAEKARLEPALSSLTKQFESGPATLAKAPLSAPLILDPKTRIPRLLIGGLLAVLLSIAGAVAWGAAMAWFNRPCHPFWCWPIGVVVGLASRFLAVRGSPILGAIAGVAACASLVLAAMTAAWLSGVGSWTDWLSNPVGLPVWLFIPNIVFWWHVGGMSAWKTATRRW